MLVSWPERRTTAAMETSRARNQASQSIHHHLLKQLVQHLFLPLWVVTNLGKNIILSIHLPHLNLKILYFQLKQRSRYQRRHRNQHQLQAIARHQKSLLRVSSLKLLLRMLKTQASVSTTTRKIRRKKTRLH